MHGDGWMVIYCTVEWVGECGLLGSLRIHSQGKTAPFPSPPNFKASCLPFLYLNGNKEDSISNDLRTHHDVAVKRVIATTPQGIPGTGRSVRRN